MHFTALKVFPQVSVAIHTPGHFDIKTSSPGKAVVEFRNTQSFSLPFSLTTVSLVVDTTLELRSQAGKITEHHDRWRSVSVGGGALAVPVPLEMPRFLRRGLGKSTSLAMRLSGVGGGVNGSGGESLGVAGRFKGMLRGWKAD